MHEEAIKWYRLYTKLNDSWIEEKFEAHMRISLCMMQLNYNLKDIEMEMFKAINLEEDRAEPHYHLGLYCNQIGEHEKGYSYFLSSKSKDLDKIKQKYVLFIRENMYGNYNNDELIGVLFLDKKI
jgi:hypothetical protein